MAEANGWDVVGEYLDNDISAADTGKGVKDRPEYNRMMADVAAGKVDRIMVDKFDRLFRNPTQQEDFMKAYRNAGHSEVWTESGVVDIKKSQGRLVVRILGAVNAAFVEDIQEKILEKHRELADDGYFHGGSAPFGYRAVQTSPDARHKNTVLEIVPAEAALIREAAERILSGATLAEVCRDWNKRGLRARGRAGRGRKHLTSAGLWSSTSLRRALTNPACGRKA